MKKLNKIVNKDYESSTEISNRMTHKEDNKNVI